MSLLGVGLKNGVMILNASARKRGRLIEQVKQDLAMETIQ